MAYTLGGSNRLLDVEFYPDYTFHYYLKIVSEKTWSFNPPLLSLPLYYIIFGVVIASLLLNICYKKKGLTRLIEICYNI